MRRFVYLFGLIVPFSSFGCGDDESDGDVSSSTSQASSSSAAVTTSTGGLGSSTATTGAQGGAGSAGGDTGGGDTGGGDTGGGDTGGGGFAECPDSFETGVVTDEDAPLGLAVDATHVYWTAAELVGGDYVHRIRRAPKDGGDAETVVTADGETGAIALTDEAVVWIERQPLTDGPSTLRAMPKDGGAITDVAVYDGADGSLDGFTLAVQDGDAFVLQRQFSASFRYTLVRVPLDGGAPVDVATHTLPVGTDARAMIVDGGEVFWAFLSGWLFAAPSDAEGLDVEPIVDTFDGVDGLAVREDEVLYLSSGPVWSRPRGEGEPTETIPDAEGFRALAATSDWVVWGARDHLGEESIRGRRGGGPTCVLADDGIVSAYSTLVDGDRIYWTNTASKAAGGAVRWVSLP